MTARLHFFVGTLAELIKVAPVIAESVQKGLPINVVSSGQNDLMEPSLWTLADYPGPDIVLGQPPRRATPGALVKWCLQTAAYGRHRLRREVRPSDIVVVHGDTVSTVLGALIGKTLGARVAHIEAGLRSFDLLAPFPEELCRRMVTSLAAVAFAPGAWASENLSRTKRVLRSDLKVIDTHHNTLADSLRAVLSTSEVVELPEQPFFLLVLHRQETLLNRQRVEWLIKEVALIARTHLCVFVMHRNTEQALKSFGLLDRLRRAPNVMIIDRQPYATFMRWLDRAAFIVTDGGSNQEESFYLGKPCLLLRSSTERREGLDANVVLSEFDAARIRNFLNDPFVYQRPPFSRQEPASEVIVRVLESVMSAAELS